MVVVASGQVHQPLLKPIHVQQAFQIMRVDVMELPRTKQENRYSVIFQDFITQWPFVFPMPDQKATNIVRLIVEEVIPITGTSGCLLSLPSDDRCLCSSEDNITSYHPDCDSVVKRFIRTLKTALPRRAAECGG